MCSSLYQSVANCTLRSIKVPNNPLTPKAIDPTYGGSVLTSQRTIFFLQEDQLSAESNNDTKHINTLGGRDVELSNAKTGGTHNNHTALQG